MLEERGLYDVSDKNTERPTRILNERVDENPEMIFDLIRLQFHSFVFLQKPIHYFASDIIRNIRNMRSSANCANWINEADLMQD